MTGRPVFPRLLAATSLLVALSLSLTPFLHERFTSVAVQASAPPAARTPATDHISPPDTTAGTIDGASAPKKNPPATDLASLPPQTAWTFNDGFGARTYILALDELHIVSANHEDSIREIAPQPDLAALLAVADQLRAGSEGEPQLVLYPSESPRTPDTRRIVTHRILVQTADKAALQIASRALGATGWESPDYAPDHVIIDIAGDPAQPLRAAAQLAALPATKSAAPLLARLRAKRSATPPNDPLFPQQWHLRNTGQQTGTAGIDINVTPVWAGFKGSGVSVGVVDDGLQLTHPDLSPNVAPDGHYDWNDGDTNPAPTPADDHGTAVGGLIAARGDNGIGVSGVAPRATLYGLRLIAKATTDYEEAAAEAWKNDVIQIKSNSWGPPDGYPEELGLPGPLWVAAVKAGAETGRGGRGVIYVWAAGNGKAYGDQGAKDAYASNRHVLAVSAITNIGVPASFTESGPHVVVCAPGDAPSGIVTTDLAGASGYNAGGSPGELADADYTQTFGGTSASTPIVSGLVALLLEANPQLGWRDVKEILLRSATKLSPADPTWVARPGGLPLAPPIKHHPVFGGGLANAQAAISLAQTWTPLPTPTSTSATSSTGPQLIPDKGSAVVVPLVVDAASRLRTEHVELTVNIQHSYRGDLEIILTSPSGTTSTFATPTSTDYGDNYDSYTFTSVRHWGEASAGTWTLSVRDALSGVTGTFNSATLTVYGVTVESPAVTTHPTDQLVAVGDTVTLVAGGTGDFVDYRWSRDGVPLPSASGPTLDLKNITFAQAGVYACTLVNPAGQAVTQPASVVVYQPAATSQTLNAGTTFSPATRVAGPVDSPQWSRDGVPLSNGGRISGADTRSLVVGALSAADAGVYSLSATFKGSPVPCGTITLAVRLPPQVQAAALQAVRLGATASLAFVADSPGYEYRYAGLPKGVTYDPTTGVLAGRVTTTGTYPLTLSVFSPFGLSTQLSITLVVEPLPPALVGTFNGYIERSATLNSDLGGAITLTTTSAGALSGKLTLGTTAYSFKGALDGLPGQPATATVSIPRKNLAPLTLQLSLPVDDTTGSGTLNNTVALALWRNPWSKTAPASAYVAPYTFALATPESPDWPSGFSTGTATVSTSGAIKWTLQPADGTSALKGSTTLSANGSWPLYAPIKSPAGSFLGALTLPPPSTPSVAIAGTPSWLRHASTKKTHANPSGFGPVALAAFGGRYSPPPAGSTVLGLPATSPNVELRFAGANLDLGAQASALTPIYITLTAQNKAVLPPPNTASLKLSVKAATGTFTGSFALNDVVGGKAVKRSVKFSGVLLSPEGIGAGAFVLPPLPGASNGPRSGSVLLLDTP